ncbi:MAG: hypothetical protein RMI89_01470 [Gloeomargarita sp. SKYBB_i_bin120]|nr:hypothetical protein [Gloeomargarita sp. SKYG98]MCS7291632.1 hypothetical protein [Gloeomargarita sp. SKYB120]MDW8177191.1 hypothetical protein [Gloeomargarita sp. SKYBB_i_bin120]
MRTDLEFRNPALLGPVVFRPGFNNFEQITATQAWSLFFTASQEDNIFGYNPQIGWFLNGVLLATVLFGAFWTQLFKNSYLVWQLLQQWG